MKLIHLISYLTLGIGYAFVILVLYWLLFPYKIIEWKTPVYQVLNKTIKQGGVLTFIGDYCKYMEITAGTSRIFENGLQFYTPEFTSNNKTGCNNIPIYVPIPKELPPGNYILKTIYKYEVNPIRTIVLEHNTEKFTVVE